MRRSNASTTRQSARSPTLSGVEPKKLATLLDLDQPVAGGLGSHVHVELAVPAKVAGDYMAEEDFAVTANWGHLGNGKAVMPGQGQFLERTYSPQERAALSEHIAVLGDSTIDVYLNSKAFWRNVPSVVWNYQLGGYQVLKKWLSYRERRILDRRLRGSEVQRFSEIARRIAALLIVTNAGPGK